MPFTLTTQIMIIVVLTAMSTANVYGDTEADYQRRLDELQNSIKSLKKDLEIKDNTRTKLQEALKDSEIEISRLNNKVREIKEARDREKKRLNQLQRERAELEQQKNKQQQHIAAIIQKIYRTQQKGKLTLLLSQQDPERLNRLITYYDYVAKSNQQKIGHYSRTLMKVDKVQLSIQETQQQLQNHYQTLTSRQTSLQSSQDKRKATLLQINQELSSTNQQIEVLKLDQQYLQELIDEANNVFANLPLPIETTTFVEAQGQLPTPTQGKLLYRFGSNHFNVKLKRHGIFISNTEGAPVTSVHHGRVIFADYLRGHGLLLIIDHGNGYMSLYGHNQTLLKDTGQWVNSGEKIATIGNSGGQQYTGLYFEIRHNGQPQNPQQWLRQG